MDRPFLEAPMRRLNDGVKTTKLLNVPSNNVGLLEASPHDDSSLEKEKDRSFKERSSFDPYSQIAVIKH